MGNLVKQCGLFPNIVQQVSNGDYFGETWLSVALTLVSSIRNLLIGFDLYQMESDTADEGHLGLYLSLDQMEPKVT